MLLFKAHVDLFPQTTPDAVARPGAGTTLTTAWPTDRDAYELGQQIGQGAFAEVFVATCKTNNQKVAIKRMELEKIQSNFEEIRKEVSY
jgi:serine/threonine protein kinase